MGSNSQSPLKEINTVACFLISFGGNSVTIKAEFSETEKVVVAFPYPCECVEEPSEFSKM